MAIDKSPWEIAIGLTIMLSPRTIVPVFSFMTIIDFLSGFTFKFSIADIKLTMSSEKEYPIDIVLIYIV